MKDLNRPILTYLPTDFSDTQHEEFLRVRQFLSTKHILVDLVIRLIHRLMRDITEPFKIQNRHDNSLPRRNGCKIRKDSRTVLLIRSLNNKDVEKSYGLYDWEFLSVGFHFLRSSAR